MWILGPTLAALMFGTGHPVTGLACAGAAPEPARIRLVRADPPAALAILLCRVPGKAPVAVVRT
jgi:hypothetical protein